MEEEQVDSSKQGRTDTSHDDNSKHSRDSDNSNSDEEKIVESTGENTQKARSQSDSTKNVKEDGPGPSIVGNLLSYFFLNCFCLVLDDGVPL